MIAGLRSSRVGVGVVALAVRAGCEIHRERWARAHTRPSMGERRRRPRADRSWAEWWTTPTSWFASEPCTVSANRTTAANLALALVPLAMTLRPPPRFVAFDAGSSVLPGSSFQWTAFTGGVHILALEPAAPLTGPPSLNVFTGDTQVTFPDLGAVGVQFPGGTDYQATVSGYSPFASLDDAVGPDGLGATVRGETASSQSAQMALKTGSSSAWSRRRPHFA